MVLHTMLLRKRIFYQKDTVAIKTVHEFRERLEKLK